MRHPAATATGVCGTRYRERNCHGYDEGGDQLYDSHDGASQLLNE
jgi:hypothetical protein